MSSHDSFSVSGSSPTKKKTKWDFRVEFHGAIILLCPLTSPGCAWVQRHIGADNGYQRSTRLSFWSRDTSLMFSGTSARKDWWRDEKRNAILCRLSRAGFYRR